ncbi:HIRAN domain-containing protein [Sphingomonas sp. PB4P5]|uniref:HIRAN domain-containing protein n=1 Tax=Parasphingomonas puruogangriensis TaxID=3096155 RepID=UPI002FC82DB0
MNVNVMRPNLAPPAHLELSLAVVGLDFPNADKSNRRFEMALCKAGDGVHLHLEPKNKADERAVSVFSERGIQLGYVTAERCGMIGAKLAAGEEYVAIFQEVQPYAAIVRVRFGQGRPTLPAPRAVAAANEDFFADPDGPQWGA